MSRKWERMVLKNSKTMNAKRGKQGRTSIGSKGNDGSIRGRSWIFPLTLALAGLLFAFTIPSGSGALYYITAALYLLLALFHYYARRPYIKIGKRELSWRTYTGIKFAPADQIALIRLNPVQSEVRMKDGKTRRTFSRFIHRYPMDELNTSLRQFAVSNNIAFEE